MKPNSLPSTKELVALARADGLDEPVILYLDQECSHARAIYQKKSSGPRKPRDIGLNTFGVIEMVSRDEATVLLRLYFSKVGECFAGMLERPLQAEYSYVWLWEYQSVLTTVTKTRIHVVLTMGYEDIMLRLHKSETKAGAGTSTLWLLTTGDDQMIPLCCPNGMMLHTGLLTLLAANRKGWVERKGKMVEIEAFDSDLAAELLLYQDSPAVIAEAIRALRKMGHEKDHWLMSVLWGRHPLRALARRVEHELSGT
jgi:hypothetical protein